MDTLTRIDGLLTELCEYVDDHHDVDCVGDPPRFVSNAWGEPLRMIGGLQQLVKQLRREVAERVEAESRGTADDGAAARSSGCEALHPAYGLYDRFPHEEE